METPPEHKKIPSAPLPPPKPAALEQKGRIDGFDPHSFVLPSKEIHTSASAQRQEAGILYAQEKSATLGAPVPAPLSIEVPPHKESDLVVPLETYQSDMAKYVRKQNISPVKVVAAEQNRRNTTQQPITVAPKYSQRKNSFSTQAFLILAGLVLIITSVGSVYFLYNYYMSSRAPLSAQQTATPFIRTDETQTITLEETDTRQSAMQKLVQAKNSISLSVGLITQLRLTSPQNTSVQLSAQTFIPAIAPTIPAALVRSLGENFLLGVHSFEVNQPFLIFSVDSYESGYANMLSWEKTMESDLLPIFAYTPTVQVPTQATSTSNTATKIIASPFSDTIIDNHDVRILKDSSGNIVLLWTFLDRSVICITTNPNTLHEAISRFHTTTQVSLPK